MKTYGHGVHTTWKWFSMSLKLGCTSLNGNKLKCIIGIHGHWKDQNPGGHFGATSQTALPIQPIWPIFLVDRLNWQCCLAGSSKTAPRILIFSMAMDADYTFKLISIKTCAPQFKWHNKSFLGSVSYLVTLTVFPTLALKSSHAYWHRSNHLHPSLLFLAQLTDTKNFTKR